MEDRRVGGHRVEELGLEAEAAELQVDTELARCMALWARVTDHDAKVAEGV